VFSAKVVLHPPIFVQRNAIEDMSSLPLVLITGVSGFIGGHVLQCALNAGYPVRVTARPAKVEAVRKQWGTKVDVVTISDLIQSDYSEALKGVEAVIHTASPLPGTCTDEELLQSTVEGGLNILRQATSHGVKTFVFTSSWSACIDLSKVELIYSDYSYTENDWSPATKENPLLSDGLPSQLVYMSAKTIVEKAVWKFADEHPEIDITTIVPPAVYGPIVPGSHMSKKGIRSSSLDFFYRNVFPSGGNAIKLVDDKFTVPQQVDVRDVAVAHVLALLAPHTNITGRKRLLVAGSSMTWKAAVEHLATARPELKQRLPDTSEAPDVKVCSIDTTKAKQVLGPDFKITPWGKTAEDTADCIVALEKSWKDIIVN